MSDQPHQQQKLRVVVLYSAAHLGSATILNQLIKAPEYEIVGLVKTAPVKLTPAGLKKMKSHLRKLGWRFSFLLFWQQLIQAFIYALGHITKSHNRLQPGWEIAKQHNIPIHHTHSINAQPTQKFLESLNADLFISAYFSQILKPHIIQIPRLGVLNVHPGWLPAYRGAMIYFWVLKNHEDHAGVSVHWIDDGIDTGQLLARRAFKIHPNATQQQVLIKSAVIGARLLRRIATKLLHDTKPTPLNVSTEEAQYYTLPTQTDFDHYFKSRRFFRIRDLYTHLIKKPR